MLISAHKKLIDYDAEMHIDTHGFIIRKSNTSSSFNFVVGLHTTDNSDFCGDWTIDGGMTFEIAYKINLEVIIVM